MPARLHATFLTTCLLFAAGACLPLGLARWSAGDLMTLALQGQLDGALEQRLAACQRLTDGKARAAAELIAGRITLRQAAERFRELNALVDDGNDDVVGPYRVVSREEALWRNVLVWVRAELRQRRDQAAAEVLARLGVEYRERFGHDPGPWPVPPPAPPSWSSSAPPGHRDASGTRLPAHRSLQPFYNRRQGCGVVNRAPRNAKPLVFKGFSSVQNIHNLTL
jgi:hypothetical protein